MTVRLVTNGYANCRNEPYCTRGRETHVYVPLSLANRKLQFLDVAAIEEISIEA